MRHRRPAPSSRSDYETPTEIPGLRASAREWLLWPDPDIRWCNRAAAAVRASYDEAPDCIFSTSPPESIHAAGLALKRHWPSAKWAADFRDHWLHAPHRRERLAWHRRVGEHVIARRWLGKIDLVTCVDQFIASELNGLGAGCAFVLPHVSPALSALPANRPGP